MYLSMQALIWSKMSTGLPIEISSSMKDQTYSSFCKLDIDIHRCKNLYLIMSDLNFVVHWLFAFWFWYEWLFFRNIPHIHVHEKRYNKERWHGAEIQIVIEGNWTTYRVFITYSNLLEWKLKLDTRMIQLPLSSICMSIALTLVHLLFFPSLLQSKILHYTRQMAVITPYAEFLFKFLSDTPE